MSQATEIYAREFDSRYFSLSGHLQEKIEARIRFVGSDLRSYPHQRLKGRSEFKLRVGDYRVIYDFNVEMCELYLITLGHRRDVYQS